MATLLGEDKVTSHTNKPMKYCVIKKNADAPILRAEVEEAIRMLKTQKSPGVDNIPAELIKHGGEAMIDAFMIIPKDLGNQNLARRMDKIAHKNDTKEKELTLL